ncbi:MAG: FtsH protease activity modulator HflK [Granulosicoccaceae bacterium]
MAWNEPGGNKNRDPWGGNDNGPPDLDEVIGNIKKKVNQVLGSKSGGSGGGGSGSGGGAQPVNFSGKGIGIIAAIALIAWLATGFFIVQPAERGVVTRFGAFVSTKMPGPNWHWPWPFESMQRVNVDQNRSISLRDQQILTKDENFVEIDMGVQYVIKSAEDYLFNNRDPDRAVKEVAESAVREVIGKETMDFIITQGRDAIAARTLQTLQESLDIYKTGLLVTTVNLESAQPPAEVQEAFSDAIKAREDEQRYINEAEAYANGIIPQARGDAAQLLEDAKGYRTRVVKSAEGESKRFSDLLVEYQKAPEVTRERIYLDAMTDVMSSSSKVMIDDESNSLLYLPMGGRQGAPSSNNEQGGQQPSISPAAISRFIEERDSRSKQSSSTSSNRSRSR